MRLLYTDEAGTSAREPVCVVVSVIIEGDRQWRVVDTEIRNIIRARVPSKFKHNFVFHATEIFHGGNKIKEEDWPFDDRLDFIKEIVCIPFVFDLPIAVGVDFKTKWSDFLALDKLQVRKSRPMTNSQFSHLVSFASCMERADYFLREVLNGEELGTVIAEDVPEIKSFLLRSGLSMRDKDRQYTIDSNHQRQTQLQLLAGVPPKPVHQRIDNIVDVPHFVGKKDAPMLQLADACAFSFRRCLSRLEHGDDLIYAMLGPVYGQTFLDEPAWFDLQSSGLFNTATYRKNIGFI